MSTFCKKSEWTKEEWAIFFANLDVLRFTKGLKKKHFSEEIGVWNIYRKDLKRPDPLTIEKICKLYNVTKDWLCSSRDGNSVYDEPGSYSTHQGIIEKEGLHACTKHMEVGGQRFAISSYDPDPRWIYNAVEEILASDDQEVILALQANVRVFVDKVKKERQLEARVQRLEKELQREKNSTACYPVPDTKTGDSG